jgi:UDP-N-acetylglucosamine acyltransferase
MANKIHPTAIIEGEVELGDDNEIGPYAVIQGPVSIGHGNWIGPHVTIGMPGQDTRNPRYDSSHARIRIGNRNIIREYTGIQKPCYRDITSVGDNVFLMQSVHVPHDAIIQDDVVITPMVAMGGICRVLKGANLALGCTVHQYGVVGHYVIVAMGAAITRHIRPFSKYIPNKPLTVNDYAIKKFGFEDIQDEITAYLMEGASPCTPRLCAIVDEFEQLCEASGRTLWY